MKEYRYTKPSLSINFHVLGPHSPELLEKIFKGIDLFIKRRQVWKSDTFSDLFKGINTWLFQMNQLQELPVYLMVGGLKKDGPETYVAMGDWYYLATFVDQDCVFLGKKFFHSQKDQIISRKEVVIPEALLGSSLDLPEHVSDVVSGFSCAMFPIHFPFKKVQEVFSETGFEPSECIDRLESFKALVVE